jgi:hypothetical protein
MNEKKKYNIPIRWESFRRFEVQADSLQEAISKALNQFLSEPDDDFLCDSFEIDTIVEEEYPGEDYDINTAI